jgi:hypothetical protein
MDVPPCEELIKNGEGREGLRRSLEDKTQMQRDSPCHHSKILRKNRTAESELAGKQNNRPATVLNGEARIVTA